MTTWTRSALLVAAPLALAVVLWWHPPGGANVYEGVSDDVGLLFFAAAVVLVERDRARAAAPDDELRDTRSGDRQLPPAWR